MQKLFVVTSRKASRQFRRFGMLALVPMLFWNRPARAQAVSPLFARGYSVIPQPQRVNLQRNDFVFGSGWSLMRGNGVETDDISVKALEEELQRRDGIRLTTGPEPKGRARTIRLAIAPGSVKIGESLDHNKQSLALEAYQIELSPDSIAITANAQAGLLYGVETLAQLVKSRGGSHWLPAGSIVDWPDLENRFIYWDDKAHLDRFEVLKSVFRQAAFYKINGVMLKLNAHFQYSSAPAVVAPYALSPGELQQLTDYGRRYHVQLIPYVDGPAHVAWILKHPEYQKLREFPQSDYELCATNPETYKLLDGIYQDVLNATRGSKYFLVSTDEPYYAGLAKNTQCNEADPATQLGSVGKLLAEFVTKTSGYLHDRGRKVIFWGEYPLKPDDVPSLPSYLINGETYGPAFDRAFKEQGIRQMMFTYVETDESMFPDYFPLPENQQVHFRPVEQADEAHFRPQKGAVSQLFDEISFWPARRDANLIGVDVCGWGDDGLHPETFWLGFVTGAAWAWHPGSPLPGEAMTSFYRLYYGQGQTDMARVYQLMSEQGKFWDTSWEWVPSSARPLLFGNSDRIGQRAPRDQTLSLPPIPEGDFLRQDYDWYKLNQRRLALVDEALKQNDELLGLLHQNVRSVQFHSYNLEVFLSIAELCRQNLEMLKDLGEMNGLLRGVSLFASRLDYPQALNGMDETLDLAVNVLDQRNRALQNATTTWYKSWYPRMAEANGRQYLAVLNDVHDYRVDRALGLNYLIERELLLPFGSWVKQLEEVRNRYAANHQLPERTILFNWQDTTITSGEESNVTE